MFTLETRISDALATKPALREILPAFHPAFAKLTHPILGKILPRLVNVADAAKVAGVDAQTLLDVMNLPGSTGGPPNVSSVAARVSNVSGPVSPLDPGWLRDPRILDVRPDLAEGREPFAPIMLALRTLESGRPLTVLAPFEPAPLVRILEKRGWTSHVAWEGDTCRASFWKPPGLAEVPADNRPVSGDRTRIDVRGLEPPEPMRRVLAALDTAIFPFIVVHDREPALLYPRLRERGLRWTVERLAEHIEIRIEPVG